MNENPSPKGAGGKNSLDSHAFCWEDGPAPSREAVEAMNQAFHQIYPKVSADLTESQITIIWNILKGGDTLNILPTGSGKSACYLVAGMLLGGLTLIITPLLSLMQDQVEKLHGQIPAACLSSTLIADRDAFYEFPPHPTKEEEEPVFVRSREAGEVTKSAAEPGRQVEGAFPEESITRRKLRNHIFRQISEEALCKKQDSYRFLYVTPERLISGHFYRFAKRAPIRLVAVDEAHCISLWGYEFRSSYLKIPLFIKRLSSRPLLAAFTATATMAVRKDILEFLDMKDAVFYPPREAGTPSLKIRKNLSFSVEAVEGEDQEKMEENRRSQIIKLCKVWTLSGARGIVYCPTVSKVRYYYKAMKEAGLSVGRYYANLDKDHSDEMGKKESWEAFLKGEIRVMVATNAMGMGVDIRDISFIIHAGMPICLENYYQEAGRAGRDGKKATCLLLYSRYDKSTCEALLGSSLQMSDLTEAQKDVWKSIVMERLDGMEDYCKYGLAHQRDELQEYIRDYFISGEEQWNARETQAEKDSRADREGEEGKAFMPIRESFRRTRQELLEKRYAPDVLYVSRCHPAILLRKGQFSGIVNLAGDKEPSREQLVSYEVCEPLSYRDLMVADAVYTLICFKKMEIYASHVLQLLSGNLSLTIKPEKTEEVYASIEKLTRTTIRIDLSKALSYGFSYSDQKKALWKGSFLPLTRAKKGYFVSDGSLPPLYEVSEILNGQFFTFPLRLLHVKQYPSLGREVILGQGSKDEEAFFKVKPGDNLPTSWKNLILTHFLLTRIDMIRSSSISPNITYESILKTLDGLDKDNRFKNKVMVKAETILTHLQHERYINGYSLGKHSFILKVTRRYR